MLYGPLYYREDNDAANEKVTFLCANSGEEVQYSELPDGYRIGLVGMYYPTDGSPPFSGMEAVRAVVKDYMEANK